MVKAAVLEQFRPLECLTLEISQINEGQKRQELITDDRNSKGISGGVKLTVDIFRFSHWNPEGK